MRILKLNTVIIKLTAFTLLSFQSSTPDTFKAFFEASNIKVCKNNEMLGEYCHARAFILNANTQRVNMALGQNAGNVLFNDMVLTYNSHARGYFDTLLRRDKGLKWNVNSSSQFSTFEFNGSAYPVFDEIINVPDELDKNNDIIIDIHSASNYDEVEFIIEDSQFDVDMPWYKRTPTSSELVINKSALQALVGPVVTIRLSFIKQEVEQIDGQDCLFEHKLVIMKSVEITNQPPGNN